MKITVEKSRFYLQIKVNSVKIPLDIEMSFCEESLGLHLFEDGPRLFVEGLLPVPVLVEPRLFLPWVKNPTETKISRNYKKLQKPSIF